MEKRDQIRTKLSSLDNTEKIILLCQYKKLCNIINNKIKFLFIPRPFTHTAHSPSLCLLFRNNPRSMFSKCIPNDVLSVRPRQSRFCKKKHVYYYYYYYYCYYWPVAVSHYPTHKANGPGL